MLLTEEEFRELFVTDNATEVNSAQILSVLSKAKTKLIGLCGLAAVTDAELANPTDAPRTEAMRSAQGSFALAALLTIRTSRLRDGGIIKTERDENGNATNTYADYSEVRKAKADLEAEAMDYLGVYLLINTEMENFEADFVYTENVLIGYSW